MSVPGQRLWDLYVLMNGAVAATRRARDAVVEAAKAWHAPDVNGRPSFRASPSGVHRALVALYDAERAEAEIRAEMEALR